MRLELTRVGLLVQLANHYTTKGALLSSTEPSPKTRWLLVGWMVVWVLCHIKLGWSFNAKFCLYIHTYSAKDFKTNIKVGRIFY